MKSPKRSTALRRAEIIEIVDHHRLSPPSTIQPIAVTTRAVGSTCTLVYEEFAGRGLGVERDVAILLLSGIISDTVNLQSPTQQKRIGERSTAWKRSRESPRVDTQNAFSRNSTPLKTENRQRLSFRTINSTVTMESSSVSDKSKSRPSPTAGIIGPAFSMRSAPLRRKKVSPGVSSWLPT